MGGAQDKPTTCLLYTSQLEDNAVEQENYSATKYEIQILAIKYVLPDNLKTQLKNISIEQQRDEKLKKLGKKLKIGKIQNTKLLIIHYISLLIGNEKSWFHITSLRT